MAPFNSEIARKLSAFGLWLRNVAGLLNWQNASTAEAGRSGGRATLRWGVTWHELRADAAEPRFRPGGGSVARPISRTTGSPGVGSVIDFYLIFTPFLVTMSQKSAVVQFTSAVPEALKPDTLLVLAAFCSQRSDEGRLRTRELRQ
jgi:hypothetical protein